MNYLLDTCVLSDFARRKTELLGWLNNDLLARFDRRILPLDAQTMLLWGALSARLESAVRPLPLMDALIAAVALQHNLILVTRNGGDFAPCGVQMINPWES